MVTESPTHAICLSLSLTGNEFEMLAKEQMNVPNSETAL